MSSDLAIQVDSLSKCYQVYKNPHDRLLQMLARGKRQYFHEFWALRNISFNVKKGETVGIIGRNGSGKSTLLQMICGTLNPTSGFVQTNGRIAALLELGSGFNPEFTGRENIYLNAGILGLSNEEIDHVYDDILSFADIGDFIDQPVRTYSSGMTVRLAFAVQAMINPDILIVDEALAVGDEKFQRKCFSRIEALKDAGTSILFVSHSAPQIVELCDRAILLENGLCLMNDRPADVVKVYQRIIYAPPGEDLKIINDLQASFLTSLHFADGAKQPPPVEFSDDFDPGLVPATTEIYPEQGSKIVSIDIQSPSGKIVNILTSGSVYRFTLKGEIYKSLERVYFGIHIKSISGAIITGQRFPEEGGYVDFVDAPSDFELIFEFKLDVLPGAYFVGGGIWSANPECPHRIIDAIMFKVHPVERQYSFGYCDLSSAVPSLNISAR
jgi:lipopolysaccharide transport system ATP-binding protein